jgi:hypothetical protein
MPELENSDFITARPPLPLCAANACLTSANDRQTLPSSGDRYRATAERRKCGPTGRG